jgi:hypothetical protein
MLARMRFLLSHPRDKDNDVARMGHPDSQMGHATSQLLSYYAWAASAWLARYSSLTVT